MLRRLLAALVFALAATALVRAQESGAAAAAAPAPSPDAARALWCGAAFAVAGQRASAGGDSAAGETYASKSAAAFGSAAAELITNGMTAEQFTALAERTARDVTAPFRATSLSEAECDALVAGLPAP